MNSEKKEIANKNGKGEKSKILFIDKIEVKRKNELIMKKFLVKIII